MQYEHIRITYYSVEYIWIYFNSAKLPTAGAKLWECLSRIKEVQKNNIPLNVCSEEFYCKSEKVECRQSFALTFLFPVQRWFLWNGNIFTKVQIADIFSCEDGRNPDKRKIDNINFSSEYSGSTGKREHHDSRLIVSGRQLHLAV